MLVGKKKLRNVDVDDVVKQLYDDVNSDELVDTIATCLVIIV